MDRRPHTYIGLILQGGKDAFEDAQKLSKALKEYEAKTLISCGKRGCDHYASLTRGASEDTPDRLMMFVDDDYLAQAHGEIHNIAHGLGIEYLYFLEAENGWASIKIAEPSDDDFKNTAPPADEFTPEELAP